LIGTGIQLTDPSVAAMAGMAGFDFAAIDTEHGPADYQKVLAQVIAARSGGAYSMVRVPWNEPYLAKRVLETGPDAILFPMVNTAEEAKKAMDSCVYPPADKRGIGPMRAQRYGLTPMPAYVEESERACPHDSNQERDGGAQFDAILKTPYLDAVLIGPCDLSFSIGKSGDVRCAENLKLIDETVGKCKRAQMPVGIWVGGRDG
jgi:2-dehydro-3-deoxyglucarate aldolase/4-hydroxy-2-oxoheptanedioate aldolase